MVSTYTLTRERTTPRLTLVCTKRNHNWFHSAVEPLPPVTVGSVGDDTPITMTSTQKSRVRFYRSVIRMTRLLGGDVMVAEVDDNEADSSSKDFGAILLWLPPGKRLGAFDVVNLWRSGLLGTVLPWHYGLTGLYRIEVTFEGKANAMFAEALPKLPPHGFKQEECGYVQMLASNPKYAGRRYASQLLKHQLHQVHFPQYPDRPVILDTSTAQAQRAYEGLGFRLLGQRSVPTDADERGIRLPKGGSAAALSEEARQRIKETCIIRAMARLP